MLALAWGDASVCPAAHVETTAITADCLSNFLPSLGFMFILKCSWILYSLTRSFIQYMFTEQLLCTESRVKVQRWPECQACPPQIFKASSGNQLFQWTVLGTELDKGMHHSAATEGSQFSCSVVSDSL